MAAAETGAAADAAGADGGTLIGWLADWGGTTLVAMATHWVLFALVLVMTLSLTGHVGAGLGLANIFREDPALSCVHARRHGWIVYRNSPAFAGQGAAALFLTMVWSFAFTLGSDAATLHDLEDIGPLVGLQVALSTLLILAAGLVRWTDVVGPRQPYEWLRAVIGTVAGLAGGWLLLWTAVTFGEQIAGTLAGVVGWAHGRQATAHETTTIAIAILSGVVAGFALSWRKLVPAVAMISLFGMIAIAYALLALLPDAGQLVAIILILLWLVIANGVWSRIMTGEAQLKFRLPGIVTEEGKNHYDPGQLLDLVEFFGRPATPVGLNEAQSKTAMKAASGGRPGQAAGEPARRSQARSADLKIDPLEGLRAWHDLAVPDQGPKPRLVLLATSGGAYRASFWTAMVLDRLIAEDRRGPLRGFCRNLRLITGASGGMVGAAYFARLMAENGYPSAGIEAQLTADIEAVQQWRSGVGNAYPYQTAYPIPRDSLSPVAQQLVQRDLPGLFHSRVQTIDRGTVLEDQWASLDVAFGALAEGERQGWRPSLVFSPMMVESGQPLMISNLDMARIYDDARDEKVEFFDLFPASLGTFKVKTAVRLNAAFPYVSPDTALPTRPLRRVVDAGYYDNYGLDVATAFLAETRIREWVVANCGGVVVVQVRAFPHPEPATTQPKALARAMQWLTTPLEGMLSARASTMTFRNRQGLKQLQKTYAIRTQDAKFVDTVVFEVDSLTSLNWYLPERELTPMREALDAERNAEAMARLNRIWQSAPADVVALSG